jgi:exodeoxyribonuclease VII small subunit
MSAPMTRENADPATLSFEDSLTELEKIVAQLERGDVALADSIRIYKRGAALKARCEGQLKDAQLEVDQIVMGPDGPRAEPARIG